MVQRAEWEARLVGRLGHAAQGTRRSLTDTHQKNPRKGRGAKGWAVAASIAGDAQSGAARRPGQTAHTPAQRRNNTDTRAHRETDRQTRARTHARTTGMHARTRAHRHVRGCTGMSAAMPPRACGTACTRPRSPRSVGDPCEHRMRGRGGGLHILRRVRARARACVCVCTCVRVHVRACVRVRACACTRVWDERQCLRGRQRVMRSCAGASPSPTRNSH